MYNILNIHYTSRLLRERMLTACTDVPADAAGPISFFDRYVVELYTALIYGVLYTLASMC